ncbi:MAG: phosphate/phosphite/phosphonate ABC transporter substrate-binding protein [Deltaproteobacteria bacterium]|nr:phosphate/phosphite/phosphonate ABC transporter substrate-binding protein [Deltaproteobacteria bacterium]
MRVVHDKTWTLLLLAAFFISFFSAPSECHSEQGPAVKIGVASMITPVDTVRYYQDVVDYIGEQIKRPVRMVHRRTYGEMDSLLERGEVNVAFICSAPYVKNREKFGVELLAAPSVNGSTRYHSYIIVHKDSTIKSFAELRGKVFAFTDPGSNTGKLYPDYLVRTTGAAAGKFFKRSMYSFSHNKSIEMVAKKIADGAAVDSLVYEYMAKKGSPYAKETKIIKRSQPFGMPPVVVTKNLGPELRGKIRDAFLNMHKAPKGKAILDEMMIDGFVQVSDRDYDSIREMERGAGNNPEKMGRTDKQTVYFGVIPRDNPRIMYEKYQPLLDYLSARTPYTYELVLTKSYVETVSALGDGETDMALLGPLTYLEARAKYGALCVLKPKAENGKATYKSVFITKKGSHITEPSQLKGKKVAFSSSKSTSGNLMPRYLLASSGIHLKDLANYDNFDYHDSVVKAVLKGRYDAGAVRDSVAARYAKFGINAIAESGPVPTGPLTVGPKTDIAVTEAVKRALLELDPRNAGHAAVLRKFDDDLKNGFTETSDKDYADIRKKINAVPETCGRECHPRIKL